MRVKFLLSVMSNTNYKGIKKAQTIQGSSIPDKWDDRDAFLYGV